MQANKREEKGGVGKGTQEDGIWDDGEFNGNMGGHWSNLDERRTSRQKEKRGVHVAYTPQARGLDGERGGAIVSNRGAATGDSRT